MTCNWRRMLGFYSILLYQLDSRVWQTSFSSVAISRPTSLEVHHPKQHICHQIRALGLAFASLHYRKNNFLGPSRCSSSSFIWQRRWLGAACSRAAGLGETLVPLQARSSLSCLVRESNWPQTFSHCRLPTACEIGLIPQVMCLQATFSWPPIDEVLRVLNCTPDKMFQTQIVEICCSNPIQSLKGKSIKFAQKIDYYYLTALFYCCTLIDVIAYVATVYFIHSIYKV